MRIGRPYNFVWPSRREATFTGSPRTERRSDPRLPTRHRPVDPKWQERLARGIGFLLTLSILAPRSARSCPGGLSAGAPRRPRRRWYGRLNHWKEWLIL